MSRFSRRGGCEPKPPTQPVVYGPNGQPFIPGSRGVYVNEWFYQASGNQAVLYGPQVLARLEQDAFNETHLGTIATLFAVEVTEDPQEVF